MTPSTVPSPAILDFFCTDEELFLALRRILSGCRLPENVYSDIDPYQHRPSNLPGEVWYYVVYNGNRNSSFGHWKPKGGDCKLYSNSSFTGWRTTFEFYEGQAPHEHKTAWVMLKYWISRTDLCENRKQKETSALCKVFLGDGQFQNHENIQKIDFSIISNLEAINPNDQLVVPDASNNMANGSTSKPEISEDDKMVELAVAGKPLDHYLEESLSEMEYLSRGDFLELLDLDNPASPSSSSENSSCLTMSSDEYFDSMALLRDLERDINHDMVQRDAACKFSSSAPSRLKKVHQGASESLVSIKRSHSPAEDQNPKINSAVPGSSAPSIGRKEPDMKQRPNQSEKASYRLKVSSSSSSHNKMVTNGQETAMDGGKKKITVGRMKKIQKKYLCFFPF